MKSYPKIKRIFNRIKKSVEAENVSYDELATLASIAQSYPRLFAGEPHMAEVAGMSEARYRSLRLNPANKNPVKKYRGFSIDITPGNETTSAYWTDGDREGRNRYSGYSMNEVLKEVKYEIDKMLGGQRKRANPAKPIFSFGPESFPKTKKPQPKPLPRNPRAVFPGPQLPRMGPVRPPPNRLIGRVAQLRPPTSRPGVSLKSNPAYKKSWGGYRGQLHENPARGFKVTKVETGGGVTWEWLNDFLSKKDARRLAANTDAIRQSDGSIAVQLYSTKILIYKVNGEIELRLGGWNTPTTRGRINALLPYGWGIFNKGGIPYVSNASGKATEVPPSDKITLTQTGAYV